MFAERGPDAVTMRDIAAAADVSAALVIRHYGSKDGLVEAVDQHVLATLEALLTQVTRQGGEASLQSTGVPTMLDAFALYLPPESAIPDYLGRLLITGGAVGSTLFARLYEISKDALAAMVTAGAAGAGDDPAVRAAFLMVNDLAVLILRRHLADVLGVDPLTAAGMGRWATEVFAIYRDGLTGPPGST